MKGKLPYRIGIGFDAHQFKRGRRLRLGGTEIDFHLGLFGYSDADVLLHALIDALTGALALPDIGTLFPDSDPKYKHADSQQLLRNVLKRIKQTHYQIAQIDAILICDQPKLTPHIPAIRHHLASLLKVPQDRIGLKAKTTEATRIALPRKSISVILIAFLVLKR
ncbi:MAG: 2-C-methyl-D-erythritol 2,4-cyclodiphosphate synthase [bacterium]